MAKWKAEVETWGTTYGVGGGFTEQTIIPLKPGTRPVCSWECWKCGKESHGRTNGNPNPCPNPRALPPAENDWRFYCHTQLGAGTTQRVNAVQMAGESMFDGMDDLENGGGSD